MALEIMLTVSPVSCHVVQWSYAYTPTYGLRPHVHLDAKIHDTARVYHTCIAPSHMSPGILIDCIQTRPRNVTDGKVLTQAAKYGNSLFTPQVVILYICMLD